MCAILGFFKYCHLKFFDNALSTEPKHEKPAGEVGKERKKAVGKGTRKKASSSPSGAARPGKGRPRTDHAAVRRKRRCFNSTHLSRVLLRTGII